MMRGMVDFATRMQVIERVDDLYARHLAIDPARLRSYYRSGRGYYPPEEAGDERDTFAVCLATVDGQLFGAGDQHLPFPLQSISKVFSYVLALTDHRQEDVLARVGVEPSGDPFNAIEFDVRHNRPHNPMINAGALVTTDLVRGATPERKLERILGVLRSCAGDERLGVDARTLGRELRTADRNRAIGYLMRSNGMLAGDVEQILTLYLQHCSVHVTCAQLARMAATLANGCVNPWTGVRMLPRHRVRDLLSVMYTCGMYDAAGEWAYDVGVPAKSSVSGAILAVVPGKLGIAVYSPGLDAYGNSVRGVAVCRDISRGLGLHLFATDDEDAVLGDAPAPDGPVPAPEAADGPGADAPVPPPEPVEPL